VRYIGKVRDKFCLDRLIVGGFCPDVFFVQTEGAVGVVLVLYRKHDQIARLIRLPTWSGGWNLALWMKSSQVVIASGCQCQSSIPASSDAVKSERRRMKHCWIKKNPQKFPFKESSAPHELDRNTTPFPPPPPNPWSIMWWGLFLPVRLRIEAE
jgi:hypothetical protein